MSEKSYVNPDNTQARASNTYTNVIKEIQKDNVCPFCQEQLTKYHKNPILKENATWLITRNMYPYKNTQQHFLLIHKKHISRIDEMTPEAHKDLMELVVWATKEFDIPGGTFFMRFGDTRYTGATVTHLHSQLVCSNPFEKDYEPVIVRVG
ncbi:HIT domain-containing protein [Candidatus Parcubacteria bacterium]|nr:HIT domain-containing protein [Candidatus Parcubacteria bacterium]